MIKLFSLIFYLYLSARGDDYAVTLLYHPKSRLRRVEIIVYQFLEFTSILRLIIFALTKHLSKYPHELLDLAC